MPKTSVPSRPTTASTLTMRNDRRVGCAGADRSRPRRAVARGDVSLSPSSVVVAPPTFTPLSADSSVMVIVSVPPPSVAHPARASTPTGSGGSGAPPGAASRGAGAPGPPQRRGEQAAHGQPQRHARAGHPVRAARDRDRRGRAQFDVGLLRRRRHDLPAGGGGEAGLGGRADAVAEGRHAAGARGYVGV